MWWEFWEIFIRVIPASLSYKMWFSVSAKRVETFSMEACRYQNQHLSVTSHINWIVARCLIHGMCFIRSWWRCNFWMTSLMTLNQLKKIDNYVIIASLKRETIGKLINRIPGSRLLISGLTGSALRTHVESLGKPRNVNKRSQSLGW